MMERRSLKTIILYLDDFLIIKEPKEEGQQAFSTTPKINSSREA